MKLSLFRKIFPAILLILTVIYQLATKDANLSIVIGSLAALVGFKYFVDAKRYEEDTQAVMEANKAELEAHVTKLYEDFKNTIETRDLVLKKGVEDLEARLSKQEMRGMGKKEPSFKGF